MSFIDSSRKRKFDPISDSIDFNSPFDTSAERIIKRRNGFNDDIDMSIQIPDQQAAMELEMDSGSSSSASPSSVNTPPTTGSSSFAGPWMIMAPATTTTTTNTTSLSQPTPASSPSDNDSSYTLSRCGFNTNPNQFNSLQSHQHQPNAKVCTMKWNSCLV